VEGLGVGVALEGRVRVRVSICETVMQCAYIYCELLEARGTASNSAYYGYPELWILRFEQLRQSVKGLGIEPLDPILGSVTSTVGRVFFSRFYFSKSKKFVGKKISRN
jgi:hypothetical protein